MRKCVPPNGASLSVRLRRFASDAASTGVASAAKVGAPTGASIAAKVGRDIPLVAIPREARRQARLKARTASGGRPAVVRTTSLPAKISAGVLVGSISGSIVWYYVLDDATRNSVKKALNATVLGDMYEFLAQKVADAAKPYTDPFKDKLLPDWPIPQVPPDTPPVPVLVLDLEDTLVHSEWSRKHGWRHAKRPGVDEFLETLAQYYEIVVFSNHHSYMAEEIVAKMDRKQAVLHVLARESTRYYNSAHVKDLAKLNRDLQQVILLDDDATAYQLQPENAIPVKPYTDGRDRDDHELKDLIPFLKALAMERVPDFRAALNEFRDDDGVIRDLPSKYGSRVRALEMQRYQEKQKGLGGFIRGRLATGRPPAIAGGQM